MHRYLGTLSLSWLDFKKFLLDVEGLHLAKMSAYVDKFKRLLINELIRL